MQLNDCLLCMIEVLLQYNEKRILRFLRISFYYVTCVVLPWFAGDVKPIVVFW